MVGLLLLCICFAIDDQGPKLGAVPLKSSETKSKSITLTCTITVCLLRISKTRGVNCEPKPTFIAHITSSHRCGRDVCV